jgi:hypothetical protein
MNCWDNLIGISKVCDATTPVSNLYVNNLTGISIENINSIHNSEHDSGYSLILEKIDFSIEQIKQHLRGHYNTQMINNSVLTSGVKGFYNETSTTKSVLSSRIYGIKLKINLNAYSELNVNSVTIRTTAAETGNILIIDLYTGDILDTIAFTTAGNEYTKIILNKTYPNKKQYLNLFIAYQLDNNNNVFDSTLYRNGSCGDCFNNTDSYFVYQSGYLDGALQKIDSNLQNSSSTFGLSVDYNLSCSSEPLICNMANMFAYPLLYKVGAELMQELKYSDRLNSYVILNNATASELYDLYNNEYMSSMNAILNNMKVPNDVCFGCKPKMTYTAVIP